jgi:alginate O-acetyltransferase complex protein AlgI
VLYLTFFPQLIAWPIVKARDFYPQIAPKRFGSINWHYAFDCLVLGYFLKKVVADSLQEQTFWMSMPYFKGIGSANLLIMLYGYSIQIFADFAGYSLIALGLAALLGYRLPDNFNFPYISQSISEFWRRWHISLSSWLRDYLYIPLGGSRHGNLRTYFNLLVVMFLGGLWHGAAWSFAVWGLWHGAGLALERPFLNSRFYTSRRTPLVALRMLSVFAFVSAGWLLFKMPVFADAVAYLQAIGSNWAIPIYPVGAFLILLYSVPVVIYHLTYLSRPRGAELMLPVAQAGMIFLIVLNAGPRVPFVYFQF